MPYHYKRKTAEEKKAELEKLTEQLEEGVTEYLQSEKYTEILHNFSKFYDYSYRNSMLIMLQKPEAEAVASYTKWKNEFNRQVNSGEKGIKIIQPITKNIDKEIEEQEKKNSVSDNSKDPIKVEGISDFTPSGKKIVGYKVAYTFDISQTSQIDGLPVVELEMAHELQGKVHDFEEMKEAIIAAAPVQISFEEITGGTKGYYDSLHNQIVINQGMSESQTLKTMIHETAHSMLHSRKAQEKRKENGTAPVGRDDMEIQAESVAYVVSEHYGLDTSDYSFPYVASWAGDSERVNKNLQEIKAGSGQIIERIDAKLEEIQKQKLEETVQDVQEEMSLTDATKELATKLDSFTHDLDPYEYNDQEIYPGSIYDRTFADLKNGKGNEISASLQEVVDENWNPELAERAKLLIGDISNYNKLSFNEEARMIAKEMNDFFEEYSPSDYYLEEYYSGCHFDKYFSEIRSGKTETADFLKMIGENKEFHYMTSIQANVLRHEILDFQEKYAEKITESLELTKTRSMKM